jgi:hypothetical protein
MLSGNIEEPKWKIGCFCLVDDQGLSYDRSQEGGFDRPDLIIFIFVF